MNKRKLGSFPLSALLLALCASAEAQQLATNAIPVVIAAAADPE